MRRYGVLLAVVMGLLIAAVPLLAQVSDDAVNDVAEHMFCPVCENEPLDDCRTSTCLQWKEEIRDQLADGRSENQIMDYFVERYGQHVLAVPSDPLLRCCRMRFRFWRHWQQWELAGWHYVAGRPANLCRSRRLFRQRMQTRHRHRHLMTTRIALC